MSLTGRAEKLIISLASLCFASVALADEHAGSVRVRIIRLEKVPEEWKSNSLAVRALIGSRFLYQTPYRGGLTPRWNNGLRMFTAHSLPMVFRVVEPGARARAVRDTRRRPSAKKQTRSDEILATGMDELVADFGPSPSGKDGEPGPTVEEGPVFRYHRDGGDINVRCEARLAWPPADGDHRLGCGTTVLVITTKWLGKEETK